VNGDYELAGRPLDVDAGNAGALRKLLRDGCAKLEVLD